MTIQWDSEEGVHVGFHFYYHDSPGIYFGRIVGKEEGERERVVCEEIAPDAKVLPYMMIKRDQRTPYCYYNIMGEKNHSPASLFALRLKGLGIPLSPYYTRLLTNYTSEEAKKKEAYEEPGYSIVGDGDKKFFQVIHLRGTFRMFDFDLDEGKKLEDVLEDLKTLYELTVDKKAFLIVFSYMLFAPFAAYVRSRRQFFPNLILLGLPETGKNSLLNLFLSSMWSYDDNVMVTGDFKTDFASMKNLEGEGMSTVINDITQSSYDLLKPYLTEGAMNPKGGSRGTKELMNRKFELLRGIAVSANYLEIGGAELISRFIIHVLKENDGETASEWNMTASRLKGAAYPIARFFLDFIKAKMSVDVFFDYFTDNRESVKDTILKIGWQVLNALLRKAGNEKDITRDIAQYEEYQEDSISLFMGWVQLALRKMQKETNWYERDDMRSVVTVLYENSLYIQETSDEYIIFPMAWKEFQRKYTSFPYKSIDAFAHAYPDFLRSQPRNFKVSRLGTMRKPFRVLMLHKMMDEAVAEPEAMQKELRGVVQ